MLVHPIMEGKCSLASRGCTFVYGNRWLSMCCGMVPIIGGTGGTIYHPLNNTRRYNPSIKVPPAIKLKQILITTISYWIVAKLIKPR